MEAYIVNMFMRGSTADTGHLWAAWGGGGGDGQCYIRQPGYITGLIYGPRGLRYNGFPLYCVPEFSPFPTIFFKALCLGVVKSRD